MKLRKAFTLVELLVVIGIIVLLISILMPALRSAWDSAKTIRCAANLRNVYQSMAAYAAENKAALPAAPATATDYYPPRKGHGALIYYFDKTKKGALIEFDNGAIMRYISPSTQIRQRIFTCPSADSPTPNYNYLLCGLLEDTDGRKKFTQIRHPAQKILLYEMDGPDDGHFHLIAPGDGDAPATRHSRKGKNGKGNYAFADGHVETLEPIYLYKHVKDVYELFLN